MEVITDVFRKVTGVVTEDNHDIILHLINDVMHNADASRDFVIKVSPDDYSFLLIIRARYIVQCQERSI